MTGGLPSAEIELRVRQALQQSSGLSIDLTSVPRETDLFDAGMASHASVNVMLAVEDLLDFEFPEDRLVKSTFSSIDSICRTVDEVVNA